MSILTLFTAPKPFVDPQIAMIQMNAIRSWVNLGVDVSIVLVGDEPGIAEAAAAEGVGHYPNVNKNASGTPLISSIFDLGRLAAPAKIFAYVNADIILFKDFLETARMISAIHDSFLLVGQRYDMSITEPMEFSDTDAEQFHQMVKSTGKLHPRGGSDYFIFPENCFQEIPDFAIGRAGWDNWMIYKARLEGWPVIDATKSITIVHQDHDYRHLPGGQSHYRLPETYENVRLAGGNRTILNLDDADYQIIDGDVRKNSFSMQRFKRELEVFPLLKLRSPFLANLAFALFHPGKAYKELRQWMSTRSQRKNDDNINHKQGTGDK